ncbi:DUF1566 domain-containing protein [Candidatus Binatia bacterium]|jgi:hypothetical protein|nr:DUF1566 domain-containing protein [Candidatus Binatia bacterium]
MEIRRGATTWLLAALATIGLTSRATAAPTAAETCQAAKNIAAGKYSACLQTAEAKYVISSDAAKRADAMAACQTRLQAAWAKAEAKAAAQDADCPSFGDVATVQSVIDVSSDALANSLGGGGAPVLPAARPLKTAQIHCFSTSSTPGAIPCAGTGQDGEFQAGVARSYQVIGFTVRDYATGLEWEKLTDDDSIHDKDTWYSFDAAMAKIAELNSSLYAGHDDWRLPNRFELETLLDLGGISPAVDTRLHQCFAGCTQLICSCTSGGDYWTSTVGEFFPVFGTTVNFTNGGVDFSLLSDPLATIHVRAVRGGL